MRPGFRMTRAGCQMLKQTADKRWRWVCVWELKRAAIKTIWQFVHSGTEAHAPCLSTHQSVSVGDVMSLMEKYCRPQSVAMQNNSVSVLEVTTSLCEASQEIYVSSLSNKMKSVHFWWRIWIKRGFQVKESDAVLLSFQAATPFSRIKQRWYQVHLASFKSLEHVQLCRRTLETGLLSDPSRRDTNVCTVSTCVLTATTAKCKCMQTGGSCPPLVNQTAPLTTKLLSLTAALVLEEVVRSFS